MTERLRAVFDTNVFVAVALSRNPDSPTRELIRRLTEAEYVLLICDALADEVIEKLEDRRAPAEKITELATVIEKLAEWVAVPAEAVPNVLADPDDDIVLACAVVGQADFLVTYDPHFDALGGAYQGVKIVKALPFLWAVRGDAPPK